MITQKYNASELASVPNEKQVSYSGRNSILCINRSPWWLAFSQDGQIVFVVPSWHEAAFPLASSSATLTVAPYADQSGTPIKDWTVPQFSQGVWVDSECNQAPHLQPIIVGNVVLSNGAGLKHDTHSGQYAAAGADTTINLDRQSSQINIWNRDATSDAKINFDKASGNTDDLVLKAGEYFSAPIECTAIHYQGGAIQVQVWG